MWRGERKPQTYQEAVSYMGDRLEPRFFSYQELIHEVSELVIQKHHDYGTDALMDAPFGAEVSVLTRVWEKINRIKNLMNSEGAPNNEAIDDSWMDIAGYALIALMIRRGEFTLPDGEKR